MNSFKSGRTQNTSRLNKNISQISSSHDIRPQSHSNSLVQNMSYYNNSQSERLYSNKSNSKSKIPKSKKSSTNKVLSNILDTKKKFNIYSPSQLKQITDEINIIENQKKLDNLNITKNYSISDDEEKNIYLIESISNCLSEIDNLNPQFNNMDINNKVLYMIHFINNEDIKVRLGSIIIEYFLLKKFWIYWHSSKKWYFAKYFKFFA